MGSRRGGREKPVAFDPVAAQERIEEQLRANAARPLFTGTSTETEQEYLPNVYTSSSVSQNNILSDTGKKYLLPIDTIRTMHEEYEEVVIPPAKPVPPRYSERLILVDELDDMCKPSFPGYASLNRIQSIVYPTAYGTNENMLICAPTGAGKTDVAMLTILNVLNQYRLRDKAHSPLASQIQRDKFKIIYVAPMKALASEIVRKLGKRLKWLSILVRELTGDMQMTKAEIAETQIIVTTPEKWDVVTRKPTGEGELATKVRLLIIDEVHLLNDERGAVIETIVARTLRQVESSQSIIRILGLSATLPNYVDVADFLRVSRQTGLFYFDASFRPVPLEQHFLGIKGKPGSQQARKNLDRVAFEKVSALVAEGHQVMVFVHARKETVKTALALKEAAMVDAILEDFSCRDHERWDTFHREVAQSRNREMRELFEHGFGIHHAGMLRSDRNTMERLFEAKAIKVLCCTATLAWGVNLPAHAVIIKGTQVYDSSQGKFVDLSVLDVLQIFGRAGRPGMETSGEGYICTPEDTLTHYLDAVTAQCSLHAIRFTEGMGDSLNAEIALGTVANVTEAVQWIGYTYLFVRMRKSPRIHGISYEEILDDPQLGNKRRELVESKARQLANARMINYDKDRATFSITDLGRIAAKYYIRVRTIEALNDIFKPRMGEADVLNMLCKCTEFEQVQLREEEVKELEKFAKDENIVPCQVKDGAKTSQGKVNILLQAFISRTFPEDFALVSDMAYVAQNAGRIVRALLEIAISRKWATVAGVLMSLSKAVEKRTWPFENPIAQFENTLRRETLLNVQRWADDLSMAELAQMNPQDIGELIRMNHHHGAAVQRVAKEFPTLSLTYDLRPLTSDLIRLSVHAERIFTWGNRSKDVMEPFWVWVEDQDGTEILQMSHVAFRRTTENVDVDFVVAIPKDKRRGHLTLRYVSDHWMGAEDEVEVPLDSLVMPEPFEEQTSLLSLPFLGIDCLKDEALKWTFKSRIQNFNLIQTHSFWDICCNPENALLCAPSGSGKSTLAQGGNWCMAIFPKRSLAAEFASSLRPLMRQLNITLETIYSSSLEPSTASKVIRLVTPRILITLMSLPRWQAALRSVRLVACDGLELLDAEYELAISMLMHSTQSRAVRFVGFSSSLSDPSDLAAWLRVPQSSICCFRPSDRDQDLATVVQSFSIPHSGALFKAMAKPAHAAIVSASGAPALVFVPSRAQTRSVANDLITQCAMELRMQGYIPAHLTADSLEPYAMRLQDSSLADYVTRGIGILHEGVSKPDRALMLELYAEGIVRVLIVPHDSCWSTPVRAGVVVVMGTQYTRVEGQGEKADRQVREYTLSEIAFMQGRAVRHALPGRFHLFCQAESKETLTRFLSEGLPLESSLMESEVMRTWLRDRWKDGVISDKDKQQTLDVLSWTYLARRIANNPMYYDAETDNQDASLSRVVDWLHSDEPAKFD
ncbi:Sec63-domain-containing protein [Schizopora paradoxa]|uniref:Sec63-domain-containing protein n=1 Tax=Schizopora paradoxa TaxID=27342 RepID=A0A0H2S777_9AGAM|nr:Sec63-domain-containing protein [Schizopora paradoxa]